MIEPVEAAAVDVLKRGLAIGRATGYRRIDEMLHLRLLTEQADGLQLRTMPERRERGERETT